MGLLAGVSPLVCSSDNFCITWYNFVDVAADIAAVLAAAMPAVIMNMTDGQSEQQAVSSDLYAMLQDSACLVTHADRDPDDEKDSESENEGKRTTVASSALHDLDTVGWDTCSGISASTQRGDFPLLDTI